MTDGTILLNREVIQQGKEICKFITEPEVRNRAVANVVAAKVVSEFFAEYDFDSETSLHNVYQILDKRDISDVYINGTYVDIRLYFNEEELCVPKSHYDNESLPAFYMFVKLEEDLSSAEVSGFILPQSVQKEKLADEYYFITESDLVSFEEVAPLIIAQETAMPEYFETLIYDFLDGKLSHDDEFFNVLLSSKQSREKLIKIAKMQNVFKFVSIESEIVNDVSLTNEDMVNSDVALLFDDESSANVDIKASFVEENLLINDDISNEFETDDLDESLVVLSEDLEQSIEMNLTDSEYNYSTEITPGINTIENVLNADYSTEELLGGEDNILDENIEPLIANPEEELSLINEEDFETLTDVVEEHNEEEDFETLTDVVEEHNEEDNILEFKEDLDDKTSEFVDETDITDLNNESMKVSNNDEILDIISKEDLNASLVEVEEQIVDDSNKFYDILSNDSELDNEKNQEVNEKDVLSDESEQINTLFHSDVEENSTDFVNELPRKKNSILPLLGIVALVSAFGYYGYNKFISNNNSSIVNAPLVKTELKNEPVVPMPVETIENVKKDNLTEEGNAIALPAIEKSLDASILVSNLSINWEVPSSYVSNNVAKRYFTKLGKIIQLNLKTELLLLSKPPITNKIVLELEFNKNLQKFIIKSLSLSSGEKAVDDIIEKTVNTVLSTSVSSNMAIFGTLQGNPSLIIRL